MGNLAPRWTAGLGADFLGGLILDLGPPPSQARFGSYPEELSVSISSPLHPQRSGNLADMPGQPLWAPGDSCAAANKSIEQAARFRGCHERLKNLR